ncbi:MAG: hypothetical protein PHD25_09395 [Bacteroidales bacterium]|nr:hypothetical protein [Bacteroidales bacterium]
MLHATLGHAFILMRAGSRTIRGTCASGHSLFVILHHLFLGTTCLARFPAMCQVAYPSPDRANEQEKTNDNKEPVDILVPVRLEITYDDHSQEKIYRNLDIWKTGIREYPIELKTGKNIQKIILGDKLTPDADTSDNVYQE